METGVVVGVITAIGGLLAGFYGLLRYMIAENSKVQKIFLEHLEKKNGHLERISLKFDETVRMLTEQILNHNA